MVGDRTEILGIYRKLEEDFARLIPQARFSKEINMKLERITHLLEVLGNPHHAFQSIHVGGTSGKGSTSTFIASILTAQGYKTGLHLSPHLQIINERYQINCQPVATTKLAQLFERVQQAIATVTQTNPFGQPSYFEAQVALAFCLFELEQVDVAVIEVGLGGRLDATNVLASTISVLTNVGLDHMEILGNTVEEIAQDKACIIKDHQIVICGFQQATTKKIALEKSQYQQSNLLQLGEDFSFDFEDGAFTVNLPDRVYKNLQIGLLGEFQGGNAACAIAAAYCFSAKQLSEAAVRQGLAMTVIPGRMEVIQTAPLVMIDGAHNPDKMASALKSVNTLFAEKSRIVVLALKEGKAAAEILPHIAVNAKLLILTTFYDKGLWVACPPDDLLNVIRTIDSHIPCQIIPDPLEATQAALSQAAEQDMVLITGSLYLAGDVREFWFPSEDLILAAENH